MSTLNGLLVLLIFTVAHIRPMYGTGLVTPHLKIRSHELWSKLLKGGLYRGLYMGLL